MTSLRLRRLQADYDAVKRLVAHHPRVAVEGVQGNPPERYRLVLKVRSLRERGVEIEIANEHRLEITLPQGYPREAPLFRMLTPVFHPNIAPHAVCIGDHWSPAEGLDAMIQRVGEMLAFQSYNTKSPLNGRAAQWVEEHCDQVPVDPQEFFVDVSEARREESGKRVCSNCGAESGPFMQCRSGHHLCAACVVACPDCGKQMCILCHPTRCSACTVRSCANCGAQTLEGEPCPQGHRLCPDCATTCQACGRSLCLSCSEVACPTCDPGAAPA